MGEIKSIADIRQRSIDFQKKHAPGEFETEPGIEEMEFEDLAPGASELMAITPVGLGKKAVKNLARDLLKQKTARAEYWAGDRGQEVFSKAFQKAKTMGKDTQAIADAFNAKKLEAEIDYLHQVEKNHPDVYQAIVGQDNRIGDPDEIRKGIANTSQHYESMEHLLEEIGVSLGDDAPIKSIEQLRKLAIKKGQEE
jgi:hypothetical protein